MNQQPFISFIMPVYNAGLYLENCIKSVLNQSDQDFELILINDGSTDESLSVCKSFLSHTNVQLLDQHNQGVSVARNQGVSKSNGKYICFVDADDSINKDYVYNLKNFLHHNTQVDIVQFGYTRISKVNQIIKKPKATVLYKNCDEYIKKEDYSHAVWSYVFKSELIKLNKISFPKNIKYSEDQEFLLKTICHIHKIAVIDKSLYNYHDRAESAVNVAPNYNRALCQLTVALNVVKYIKEKELKYTSFLIQAILHLVDDYFFYLNRLHQFDTKNIRKDYQEFYHCIKEQSTSKKIVKNIKWPLTIPILVYMKYSIYKNKVVRKLKK